MRVAFDGITEQGPAVDLRDADVDANEVLAAVRDPDDDRVRCARPRSLHERVGFLHCDATVSPVAALAAAARSRGTRSEHDDAILETEDALQSLDVPDVDLASARRRVAETEADVTALRERVARASGEVAAHRSLDADEGDVETAHRTAARELAVAETEHHAAREALATARRRARDARDARERRLELEDRRENLRRGARRELAAAFTPSFERALSALPVPGEPAPLGEFDGPAWAAVAAIARVARLSAPLVVADVFERAPRARAALDAPVLLVEL
ncbi:hypothetical protein [Halobacterium zhouii]|uniref:DUF7856 family protein n=1 Tax=Halobacterium zhouii TaxID=2902624 RepID=UPI001E60F950|nr:hypothetical protein [Halobacterium zhouii]